MKVLIVEDEKPIARYIELLCKNILKHKLQKIYTYYTLDQAKLFLFEHPIDLCLLDINLNGKDGYELLKLAVSGSFHTIVISAITDRAVEAFEYGVLDFIAKPFDEDRLRLAFNRYFNRRERKELMTKYLAVRKFGNNMIICIDDVLYFKAADIYVDAHLTNGKIEILDKTMERLEQVLPQRFVRIHRSYLVDITQVDSYRHCGGGTYQVITKSGETLPLSRQKYKELHELLNF